MSSSTKCAAAAPRCIWPWRIRNVPVAANADQLHDLDVVTFTSASTVDNFFAAIGDQSLDGALLASIGPMTSEAIRKHGRQADIEAGNASIQALHDAVVARLGGLEKTPSSTNIADASVC